RRAGPEPLSKSRRRSRTGDVAERSERQREPHFRGRQADRPVGEDEEDALPDREREVGERRGERRAEDRREGRKGAHPFAELTKKRPSRPDLVAPLEDRPRAEQPRRGGEGSRIDEQ